MTRFQLVPIDIGNVPKTAYVTIGVTVVVDVDELSRATTSADVMKLARKKTCAAIESLSAKLEELPVEIDRARALFPSNEKNLSGGEAQPTERGDCAPTTREKTSSLLYPPADAGMSDGRASEVTGRRRTENRRSLCCESGRHIDCGGTYLEPTSWPCRCSCHLTEQGGPQPA